LPSADFESAASASSAIPALQINPHNTRLAQTSAATFADTHHTSESSTQPNTSGLIVFPVSHSPGPLTA
jgi:hypothetical protein